MSNPARIGGALTSVVALTVGLLGLVHSWPQWLLVALGALGLVGLALEYLWEYRRPSDGGAITIRQNQKGGPGSRNYQAGRDVRFNGGADARQD
jgi:hypothetical protein